VKLCCFFCSLQCARSILLLRLCCTCTVLCQSGLWPINPDCLPASAFSIPHPDPVAAAAAQPAASSSLSSSSSSLSSSSSSSSLSSSRLSSCVRLPAPALDMVPVWRQAPPRDLSALRWAPISSPIMPLPQLRPGLRRPAPLDGSGGEPAAVARKGGLLTSLAATTRLQANEDEKLAEAEGKVSRKRGRVETKEEKARVKRKEKRVARRASRRKTYQSEAKKFRKKYEQAVARYERLAEKELRKLRRHEVDNGQISDEREAELRLLGDQREAARADWIEVKGLLADEENEFADSDVSSEQDEEEEEKKEEGKEEKKEEGEGEGEGEAKEEKKDDDVKRGWGGEGRSLLPPLLPGRPLRRPPPRAAAVAAAAALASGGNGGGGNGSEGDGDHTDHDDATEWHRSDHE